MQSDSATAEPKRFGRTLQRTGDGLAGLIESYKHALLALFSVCYFAETCYRASRKLFWFDEIFTVYISNLASLGAIWPAVLHGADLNPPLLYFLTRWSQAALGHNELGARFPEIIGFYIFCLCLFRFVSVRTNALAGLIAMLFPMVTNAYWYAYEARPHGLVLGFCGLSLICWQAAASKTDRSKWWLAGLGGSLAGAMLTHSYAFLLLIPIGVGELTRTILTKRIDRAIWFTMLLSASTALISIPLLLGSVKSALSNGFRPAPIPVVVGSYVLLLRPASGVLAIGATLMLIGTPLLTQGRLRSVSGRAEAGRDAAVDHFRGMPPHELMAVLGLLIIPLFTFLAARLAHAPMFHRYSLAAVGGLACLFGIVTASRSWVGILVLILLVAQIGVHFWEFLNSSAIEEPSSGILLSTSRGSFNDRYDWILSRSPTNVPVLLLSDLEFAPMFNYAPANVLPRLVYIPTNTNGLGYMTLQRCCHAPGEVLSLPKLVDRSKTFFAYGPSNFSRIVDLFRSYGAHISVEKSINDHRLFLVQFPPDNRGKPNTGTNQ